MNRGYSSGCLETRRIDNDAVQQTVRRERNHVACHQQFVRDVLVSRRVKRWAAHNNGELTW
jgi:uncharacterized protein (DUF488 family)